MAAARTCAKRAHQLAASILSNGVGPSRLPAASSCRCHLHSSPKVASFSTPRHFSASSYRREEDSQRWEQQVKEPPSSSPSSRKAEKANVGLFIEEVADAEPTLEYLDSLKPRLRRFRKDDHRPKRDSVNPFSKSTSSKGNPEDKLWERTKARLNASFTRDQLATLARAAKLPGSYARSIRKDELVRRIMLHRFGMEDARERADREKREDMDKRSVHIAFRPAELYLLLARGSNTVRQEAGKARVVILPKAPAKTDTEEADSSEQLGFWIRGKDEGIAQMVQWVQEFKQSVKIKEEEVVLSAEAGEAVVEVLPAELVRLISQLSNCFMEASPVQDGKVKLSLAYLQERDAQKAVLLLRQYQAESAEAIHRIGAAAYNDGLDTLRMYSMLPFVPNEPTSWIKQADDLLYGSTSDVDFRVSHLPEMNAFSLLPAAKLLDMNLKGWSHGGDLSFSEPFQSLLEAATASAARTPSSSSTGGKAEVECSATLGHILFRHGGLNLADEGLSETEVLSRLSDPLASPHSGSWPIEGVLKWTRDFHTRFGREPSRFVPTTIFRSQKNVSLDIWLERQGYLLANKGTPDAAREQIVLIYQPAEKGYSGVGGKLELVVRRSRVDERDASTSAKKDAAVRWELDSARWVAKAEGDMMLPEKSADLRLCAKTISPLGQADLAAVQESLATYLDTKASTAHVGIPQAVEAAEQDAETDPVDEVEADAIDILGNETEVVDRSSAPPHPEEVEANSSSASSSLATHSSALPPSILTLPSMGKLGLESAIKRTVRTYVQRSSLMSAAPVTMPEAETEAIKPLSSAEAIVADGTESEAVVDSTTPSAAIDVAEEAADSPSVESQDATENAAPAEPSSASESAVEETSEVETPFSPSLIREISQDLVTKATAESLRITWGTQQTAPEWNNVVEAISALVDRHDTSIR
ncbi:uncharacterized protein UTRI_00674_B [Ustilago trichophora]|uniref:Uncharacterized protein n=1 Tax=Ustilago trichophora TaxID=86804 RepID=A0A5C3DS62_9BASI|nr:uncharacterized protein UTRI_00674_B [Ustilago trichophora]